MFYRVAVSGINPKHLTTKTVILQQGTSPSKSGQSLSFGGKHHAITGRSHGNGVAPDRKRIPYPTFKIEFLTMTYRQFSVKRGLGRIGNVRQRKLFGHLDVFDDAENGQWCCQG